MAPGKPALQSSTDADHVAGFAVDGDITTCAMGNTRDHQWLLVDLRYQHKVAEVIIVTGNYSGNNFNIIITSVYACQTVAI